LPPADADIKKLLLIGIFGEGERVIISAADGTGSF
jgi:hypothetical protein